MMVVSHLLEHLQDNEHRMQESRKIQRKGDQAHLSQKTSTALLLRHSHQIPNSDHESSHPHDHLVFLCHANIAIFTKATVFCYKSLQLEDYVQSPLYSHHFLPLAFILGVFRPPIS